MKKKRQDKALAKRGSRGGNAAAAAARARHEEERLRAMWSSSDSDGDEGRNFFGDAESDFGEVCGLSPVSLSLLLFFCFFMR